MRQTSVREKHATGEHKRRGRERRDGHVITLNIREVSVRSIPHNRQEPWKRPEILGEGDLRSEGEQAPPEHSPIPRHAAEALLPVAQSQGYRNGSEQRGGSDACQEGYRARHPGTPGRYRVIYNLSGTSLIGWFEIR